MYNIVWTSSKQILKIEINQKNKEITFQLNIVVFLIKFIISMVFLVYWYSVSVEINVRVFPILLFARTQWEKTKKNRLSRFRAPPIRDYWQKVFINIELTKIKWKALPISSVFNYFISQNFILLNFNHPYIDFML